MTLVPQPYVRRTEARDSKGKKGRKTRSGFVESLVTKVDADTRHKTFEM